MNPLFVVQFPPPTYAQGSPRELNDGSVVRGSANSPKSRLSIFGGAPGPAGLGIGTIGASNSTCGSDFRGVVVELHTVASLAKYTNPWGSAEPGQSTPLQ